jgi:hypothetical protein
MKEWHRTVILVAFLLILIALIIVARRIPESNLV